MKRNRNLAAALPWYILGVVALCLFLAMSVGRQGGNGSWHSGSSDSGSSWESSDSGYSVGDSGGWDWSSGGSDSGSWDSGSDNSGWDSGGDSGDWDFGGSDSGSWDSGGSDSGGW